MADYSLVPVDHQPEFDHSLVPVDHDPFADGSADDMARKARAQLASQNLRNPAAFDPQTYAPTTEADWWGGVGKAMPKLGAGAALGRMIVGAAMIPKQAMESVRNYENTGNYDPGPVLAAAMFPMGIAGTDAAPILEGKLAQSAGKMLESRSSLMYNPPAKSPRPFGEDYRSGVIGNDGEKLQSDVDGNPLVGAHISGRRVVRGADEAISPAEYDAITKGSIGTAPAGVAAASLPRGSVGRYLERLTDSGPERSIDYLKTLQPSAAAKVVAHEMGHMIDELSGQIPTSGLSTELRQIYSTLNTGRERTANLMGPQHLGYSGEEVPRELMAEALRAYMTNPNYIKTVAPQTAARIREYVNSNPSLSRTIQFNGIAAPLAIGGGAGAFQFIPVDHDPFAEGDAT